MKQFSEQELSYTLSLYLDGELPEREARALEEFLATHPEASQELRELRAMKQILHAKEKLPPDIGFWTRLSVALDHQKAEERNLLPFPRRFVPVATVLGALSMVVVGVIVFQQRDSVLGFLSQKSEEVQQVYESNFLKGAVTPLLANLDNDNVLQFALFGTLPLDEQSATALRVDETTEQGYRIEVGKSRTTDPQTTGTPREGNFAAVTVSDFYKEIRPTPSQELMIDSVLRLTQKQLVSSVFMAANEALAIDPGLPKLGRVTVSSIAACLEQPQRVRFEKFLKARNAPYSVVSKFIGGDAQRRVHEVFAKLQRPPRPEQFVVVTPETLVFRQLEIDIDSLREQVRHAIPKTRVNFERFTQQFRSQKKDQHMVFVGTHPMRVRTGEGAFSIEIGAEPQGERQADEFIQIVKPRHPRQNFFFYEYKTPDDATAVGDSLPFDEERLDSMFQLMQVGKVKSYGPKLDSLMRKMERQRVLREKE